MWLKLLLNQTVRQAAEGQVRRWLEDSPGAPTASGEPSTAAAEGTGGAIDAEQLRADVLLVFGSQAEAGGWIDGASIAASWPIDSGRLVRGRVGELEFVVWLASGERQDAAVDQLLEGVRPRLVVVAGFGIGLAAEIERGMIVVGTEVSDVAGATHRSALTFAESADDLRRGLKFGKIVTLAAPPAAGVARTECHQRTGALLADPDGVHVIEVCARREVPWIAVRIATEGADETPSIQLRSLLDQATLSAKIGAAVGSLWQEPLSAKELWRIQEDALQASDRLAKFLRSFLGSLT